MRKRKFPHPILLSLQHSLPFNNCLIGDVKYFQTFYERFTSSTNWPLEDVLDKVIQYVVSQYVKNVTGTLKKDRRFLQSYYIDELSHILESTAALKSNFDAVSGARVGPATSISHWPITVQVL